MLLPLLFAQQVDSKLMPTGQLIAPTGLVSELPGGRPVDMRLSPDAKTLFVKDRDCLRVLDSESLAEVAKVPSPGGASLWGMDVSADGRTVYFTNSEDKLHEFVLDGTWKLARSMELPGPGGKGNSFPCGVRVGKRYAYVCLSLNNTLAIVNLASGKLVQEVPTGIAPYDVEISDDEEVAYVSNLGGRRPAKSDKTAPSADTDTPVDDRGIAKTGTVTSLGLYIGRSEPWPTRHIDVGLQPCDLLWLQERGELIVANANSDSITWINSNTGAVKRMMVIKPDSKLPFGSMPNALAASADGTRLYVALAGNNAVAVVENGDKPRMFAYVPSGWYPAALALSGSDLWVANNKGVGSRTPDAGKQGLNTHGHRGSIQKVSVSGDLRPMTAKVRQLAFVPQILKAFERSNSPAKARPIPRKLGEPSTIEHVVYVIKENRTYDQMFGDIAEGDGDANLCTFPELNSPNHHALAREFVLLDNYYCNGVLSADGHSWATEGNVTPYLERAFGGFNRSYTFGDDPITYSSSGFVWDKVLGAGLSFRNYGEMNYAEPAAKASYKELVAAHKRGERVQFRHNIGIERLRRYSDLEYPGWNLDIPDQIRIDEFMREFREFEQNGRFPTFTLIYLPQDHLGGPVSSRAHMADNDLAVGRLVEAISHSRFWPKTAIFINEDDPQNGYDHVDGHRSVCLVVSPYTKRKAVVSEFYNQTSVLRTMLHILGLSPLNQRDASSNLMSACFTDQPNLTPYVARKANFSLDDSDLKKDTSVQSQHWAKVKATLPLKRTGMKTEKDDDNLNRMVWHEMKGWNTPYPAKFVGPHGKGLKKRGLKHDEDGDEDER